MTDLELKVEALAQAVKAGISKDLVSILNDAREIFKYLKEEVTPSAPAQPAQEGSAIV